MSKAGTYSFKTVKGNSFETVGNVIEAKVLWESFGTTIPPAVGDLVKDVSYSNGKITFTATNKKGNAVIAARDDSGKILWSWHIWMTDVPRFHEYFNDAGIAMDRNLGATSAIPGDEKAHGLLYQWGRKDPFLSKDYSSTINWPKGVYRSQDECTIDYATANPTKFIVNSTIWDWLNQMSAPNVTRWTESGNTKSIYDPCPYGWRVPDGGEDDFWGKAACMPLEFRHSFDHVNKGMNFSGIFGSGSTIWYPAAGFRFSSDVTYGELYDVGRRGYYWTASHGIVITDPVKFSFDGRYSLEFKNDDAVSTLGFPITNGCSVRCVKE